MYRIDRSVITVAQRVRYAIYCAQEVGGGGPIWDRWAAAWLSGDDRSSVRAQAAWTAAKGEHAARAAAHAADCAAQAAEGAVKAASKRAEKVAAWAAEAGHLDLLDIARRAIEDETGAQPQGE